MSGLIGRLAVSLTMNTAAFQKGATLAEKRAETLNKRMAGIGSSIAKIGGALALGAVAGGAAILGGMAKSAFELGSSLTEAASKVGVTVEALQEMRFAATQNGISIETMDGSLNKMTRTLGELSLGNKAVAANFKELGMSARDFVGLTPTESFAKIADALKGIESETERAALGNKIFGRSYAELKPLIDLGAAGINAAAEAKRKDGVVSTEQAAKLDDLADGWDRLKEKVGVASAQFIANTSSSKNAAAGIDGISKSVTGAIESLGEFVIWLRKAELAQLKLQRVNLIRSLGNPIVQAVPFLKNNARQGVLDTNARIQQLESNNVGKSGNVVRRGLDPDLKKRGGAGGVLAGSMAGAASGALATFEKLEKKASTIGVTVGEPMTRAAKNIADAFRDLSDNVQPLLDRLFPEVKALIDYEADKNALAEWAKAGKIDADKLTESLGRLRDSYYGTEGGAFTKDESLIDNITDSLPDMVTELNKTSGLIDRYTDEYAESFESSAQRVIGSIGNMAQAIKGGGFIGILEGLSSLFLTLGSVGTFGSEMAGRINGKRARGGAMTSNRSYLVGERGPEIMTMGGRPGYMTPNNKLGMGGGRAASVQILPSKYFDVVVDGRASRQVAMGAPGIATAAAAGVQTNLQQSNFRTLP